jgi:molecular chaperone GrpE
VDIENEKNDSPGVTEEGGPTDNNAVQDVSAQLTAVIAERDQLAGEKAELHDRLLRRQAEFENYRRRSERDRSDFIQFAGMEIVRELLPVIDDFERALKVESADREYAKGIELIYSRLFDILKKQGLEPIESEGKSFDPHLHQAVERVETDSEPDQTILAEFQRGYNFKGKLLRPSMVKVAVKPS